MNRKQITQEIEFVCKVVADLDDAYDAMHKAVGCDIGSPLWTAIFATQEALINQTAKLIGDDWEWLNWYIYENESGARGFEASPGSGKPMRKIKTAAHLARLIEESRDE